MHVTLFRQAPEFLTDQIPNREYLFTFGGEEPALDLTDREICPLWLFQCSLNGD